MEHKIYAITHLCGFRLKLKNTSNSFKLVKPLNVCLSIEPS